ncbi:MAG: TrmB family transcriptional regulator [Burkholderiales bacterium]|nr:TrmB family transcriptional regulator [Burkholderiales bacterium]
MRRRAVIDIGPDGGCVEDLQSLGFTSYEARVYMALLRYNPATAYEVSKQTGLARANVYNALERLAMKLAVQPVNENPGRYVPVDPKLLLDRIAHITTSRCSDLVDKLSATKAVETTEFVWTLTGDDNIHAKMTDMIDKSRKHIWVKAAHHLLSPHIRDLKVAAERGIKVLIILFGEPAQVSFYEFSPTVKIYLHESTGMMVGMSDRLLTLTTDFEEAMTATMGTDGYGVFTRSRPVVNIAESLIRHEIYVAEIFGHFGEELDKTFGPALLSLRQQYLPNDQIAMLKRTLKKGQRTPAKGSTLIRSR